MMRDCINRFIIVLLLVFSHMSAQELYLDIGISVPRTPGYNWDKDMSYGLGLGYQPSPILKIQGHFNYCQLKYNKKDEIYNYITIVKSRNIINVDLDFRFFAPEKFRRKKLNSYLCFSIGYMSSNFDPVKIIYYENDKEVHYEESFNNYSGLSPGFGFGFELKTMKMMNIYGEGKMNFGFPEKGDFYYFLFKFGLGYQLSFF